MKEYANQSKNVLYRYKEISKNICHKWKELKEEFNNNMKNNYIKDMRILNIRKLYRMYYLTSTKKIKTMNMAVKVKR